MFSSVTITRTLPTDLVLICINLGEDYLVVLYGGTIPHIGAVTLSCYAASTVKNANTLSSRTSTLSVYGHKEYVLFNEIAPVLSDNLNHNIAVVGGIHVDNASRELLTEIQDEVRSMCDELIIILKGQSKQ